MRKHANAKNRGAKILTASLCLCGALGAVTGTPVHADEGIEYGGLDGFLGLGAITSLSGTNGNDGVISAGMKLGVDISTSNSIPIESAGYGSYVTKYNLDGSEAWSTSVSGVSLGIWSDVYINGSNSTTEMLPYLVSGNRSYVFTTDDDGVVCYRATKSGDNVTIGDETSCPDDFSFSVLYDVEKAVNGSGYIALGTTFSMLNAPEDLDYGDASDIFMSIREGMTLLPSLYKVSEDGTTQSLRWLLESSENSAIRAALGEEADEADVTYNDDTMALLIPFNITPINDGYVVTGVVALYNDTYIDEEEDELDYTDQLLEGVVIKLDQDGKFEGLALQGDGNFTEGFSIYTNATATSDGGVAISGVHFDANMSSYLMTGDDEEATSQPITGIVAKFDANLNQKWTSSTENANRRFTALIDITELEDGTIATVGVSTKLFPLRSYLATYNADGSFKWDKTWLDEDTEAMSSAALGVTQYSNGHIATVGVSANDFDLGEIFDTIAQVEEAMDGGNLMDLLDIIDTTGEPILRNFASLDASVVEYDLDGKRTSVQYTGIGINTGVVEVGDKIAVAGTEADVRMEGISRISLAGRVNYVESQTNEEEIEESEDEESDIKVPDTGLFTGISGGAAKVIALAIAGVIAIIATIGVRATARVRKHNKAMNFKK